MKTKIIIISFLAAIIAVALLVPKTQNYAAFDNSEICSFAEENGIKPSDYPNELVAMLERNPETRDFVLNYPLKKDAKFDCTVTLPENGSVPLFLQWDERWGYMEYSGDLMGLSGCGPTTLSMAAAFLLKDETLSPAYIATFSDKNGFSSYKNGSSWKLMSKGAERLGLHSEELVLWEASMANALAENKLIICAMGNGDFTSSGHFILICGYENGLFSVRDPNSKARSERLWSYETLSKQIDGMWSLSV
ncbi:MAG: C39 family peptidase [Oscillospiraceae bacterium]|nr:C39 family peptidase [Oscillospiraceae bacterium]